MNNVTFGQMVKQIPIRLAELVVKLLSVKGFILGMTVWLTLSNVFDPWAAVAIFIVVIFGREALKALEHLK